MIDRDFKSIEEMNNMINMSDEDIAKLTQLTKGFSGADLKALSTEAAMMPLREIVDVQNCQTEDIRPLELRDFEEAIKNVRSTVQQKDLDYFLKWNDDYGSFPIKPEDIAD